MLMKLWIWVMVVLKVIVKRLRLSSPSKLMQRFQVLCQHHQRMRKHLKVSTVLKESIQLLLKVKAMYMVRKPLHPMVVGVE